MEISGERARLLGVDERAQHLFGREELEGAQSGRKKKATQIDLLCISRSRGWRRDLVWAGGRAAGRNNPRPVASVDDPFRRRPWGAAEAVLVEEGAWGRIHGFGVLRRHCRHCSRPLQKKNGGSTACSLGKRAWDFEIGRER